MIKVISFHFFSPRLCVYLSLFSLSLFFFSFFFKNKKLNHCQETMTESWEFYSKALRAMIGLGVQRAMQQIQAVSHRWTRRDTENAKNVVIIGGSYAGIHLARRLSETLPMGYKAVLVERNSHFNHLYVFPRFAVVPSRELRLSPTTVFLALALAES